jgi:Cytochrome c554 and c-prime
VRTIVKARNVPRFPVWSLLLLFLAAPVAVRAQLSTPDHLSDPGFWPTKSDLPRSDYAGSAACESCHRTIFEAQTKTSMANTAQYAEASAILRAHPGLAFATGPYHYQITPQGNGSSYSITTDDHQSLKATLEWAFGTGRVGQSYLFRGPDESYLEAKVTYFSSLQNLNFTPDRAFTTAADLEDAFRRPVSNGEVARCFGCHTTASKVDGKIVEKGLFLGVACEACHGPAANHVAAMREVALAGTSYSGPPLLVNPATLDPVDSVDFCGACHATWWDVKLAGTKGPTNARSQPYRLELSKCWGNGDKRLTCMGCHDPHYQLNQNAGSYDHVCLSCHSSAAGKTQASAASTPDAKSAQPHPATNKTCPVATKDCTSCHMPKVLVPEMHYKFTDHKIQIAQPNAPYKE